MDAISGNKDSLNQLLNPHQKSNSLMDMLKAQQQEASEASKKPAANGNDVYSPSQKGVQTAAAAERFQQSYSYSETMQLSLKTREGDTVQVDFRQLYAQYRELNSQQVTQQGPQGVRQFESTEALEATAFEESFGFSVQGELNEDELKAVFDIFEQVDKLATEFFDGDVEKAFENAQKLEIDFGQIQSFSLELQKTETVTTSYQKAQAYEEVSQQPEDMAKQAGVNLSQLPPYLESWQSIIEQMDAQFEDARKSFDEIMSATLSDRAPEGGDFSQWFDRVSSFHDQLAEAAGLDKQTLKPSEVEVVPLVEQPATPTAAPAQPIETKE